MFQGMAFCLWNKVKAKNSTLNVSALHKKMKSYPVILMKFRALRKLKFSTKYSESPKQRANKQND